MAIYGLESNYYCAHTPIPVQVTPLRPEWGNMYVQVTDGFSLNYSGRLYKVGDYYYVDLSPWVKMLMHELKDTRYYYTAYLWEAINEQVSTIDIYFNESNNDESDPQVETQYLQKQFVQCALYSGKSIDVGSERHIKLWEGYPYSWHIMQTKESLYAIPNGPTPPFVNPWIIEYDTSKCKGSYLKWLNEYGSYYYWKFEKGRDESNEGENIFDVPRSIFDTDKQSNYDTVGFEPTNKLTLRDRIPKKYWHIFESLPSSPEVYILKDGWIDQFNSGMGTLTPDWWIKLRQTDFSFDRTYFKNSMTELEIELEYPKPYTQKRI